MNAQVRVGLIGSGMMGLEHVANMRLFPQIRLVAVADPTPSSLDTFKQFYGPDSVDIDYYTNTEQMIAGTDLDAVVIVSPNHTHADVLKVLFSKPDLHILCEKPLCSDLADARWVAEAATKHRGVFWVGMEYRFMPPVTRFTADIHAGRIGRLQMLAIREHRFPFLVKIGDWNRFSRNTGGTMVEKCCHFFDLMRHIVRAEPVRIYCSGAMDVNHQDERYGGEKPDIIDNSYTIVDFDNGVRAMLDLCMFAEGSESQEEIAAVGAEAKLEVMIPPGDLIFSPRTGFMNPKRVEREQIIVDEAALQAGQHFGATFYQLQNFLAAVQTGAPVQVTARDGLMAVAMGTAAEISAREKRAVLMSELLPADGA